MTEENKRILTQNAFIRKKDWIWCLILFVGAVMIIWALCRDFGLIQRGKLTDIAWWEELCCKLWNASGSICDVVVAYSTMMAAIVVFYYSVIENKRLGIPYRRIISYTVGSHTIPVLFVAVLLLTIFMLISYHTIMKHTVYVCAFFILTVQTFAIIMIMQSTSYEHGKSVICRIERKKYLVEIGREKLYNEELTDFFGHLEYALCSGEFISDKKDFLMEFLWIPFKRNTGTLYKGEYLWERLGEKQLLEKVYYFYFLNLQAAFQNLDGSEHHLERNQLYMSMGEFIRELAKKAELRDTEEGRIFFYIACSGIVNGLISSNVEDSFAFCDYVFTKCMSEEKMIERQLGLLVLFHEVLDLLGRKSACGQFRIRGLEEWKSVETQEFPFYAKFWKIWTNVYNITRYDKMRHFLKAMQTMGGYHIASVAISRLLVPMREKIR